MALSDIKLRPYTPAPAPVLEASKEVYLQRELVKIRKAIDVLNDAVAQLIVAVGP